MTARRSVLLLASALATASVLAACGGSAHNGSTKAAVPANSVALVDGKPILRSDLDHLVAIHLVALKSNHLAVPAAGTAGYTTLQREAMLGLFQQEVIREEGAKRGIKVDPAAQAATLRSLKAQAGGDAAWNKQLKKDTSTDADYLNALAIQQLSQGLQTSIVKQAGPVTDADVKAEYDRNPSLYKVTASRKIAHILFGPADGSRPLEKDLPKYRKAAENAIRQLRQGADFTALVMSLSTDRQKTTNQGVYNVPEKGTDAHLIGAVYALKAGAFTTAPVKSAYGYHVIKALSAPTKDHVKALSEVAAEIRTQLEAKRTNTLYTAWFTDIQAAYLKTTTFASGFGLPARKVAAGATGSAARRVS
jgi:parvulin-like peptidyl-prolyl isomerase